MSMSGQNRKLHRGLRLIMYFKPWHTLLKEFPDGSLLEMKYKTVFGINYIIKKTWLKEPVLFYDIASIPTASKMIH